MSSAWMAWWAALWTQAPALPDPALAHIYLPLAWGLVLASAGAWLGRRFGARLGARFSGYAAWGLAVLGFLWAGWPGPQSAAYSLGLAFQAPSLMSVLLCAVVLARALRRPFCVPAGAPSVRAEPVEALVSPAWSARVWPLLGIALGWVLVLDTWGWLPCSVYAWGFMPGVAALVVFVLLLASLRQPQHPGAMGVLVLLALCVALQISAHLPTGNVWDALLDPWLWLFLHVRPLVGVANFGRGIQGTSSLTPTTK